MIERLEQKHICIARSGVEIIDHVHWLADYMYHLAVQPRFIERLQLGELLKCAADATAADRAGADVSAGVLGTKAVES